MARADGNGEAAGALPAQFDGKSATAGLTDWVGYTVLFCADSAVLPDGARRRVYGLPH
jgi:hypothetical protein